MTAPTVAYLWRDRPQQSGRGGRREGCGRKRLSRPFAFDELERLLPGRCVVEKAHVLGVDPRLVYRYREQGLTVDQADEFAVRIGRHPSEVFSGW